jgi:hypothetical protein
LKNRLNASRASSRTLASNTPHDTSNFIWPNQ